MITGAHTIIYSRNADADRAFLKDVLGFPHVDVGHGWLIFGLPPAEIAIHPAGEDSHELYLMTDDVAALIDRMTALGLACEPVSTQPWGLLTSIAMPGGSKLGIYEPRHARPEPHAAHAPKAETTRHKKGSGKAAAKKKPAAKPTKKAAKATKKAAKKKSR